MNQNNIYNDWVKDSAKFFSKFKPEDFFSDKVNHIYFYGDVSKDYVDILMYELKIACKTKINNSGVTISLLPIVIHLDSLGGSALAEINFESILQTVRVPLCTMIENDCASAATSLALLSPYRVMIEYSDYMIHDMAGGDIKKYSETIKTGFGVTFHLIQNYLSLIKSRTKLSDNEIKKFMDRDILLDCNYCLKKKIVDKVIKFPKINSDKKNADLPLDVLLKKTNLNHIYLTSDFFNKYDVKGNKIQDDIIIGIDYFSHSIDDITDINTLCIFLDKYFLSNLNENKNKQFVLHFQGNYHADYENIVKLCYRLALLQKKSIIIGLVEGPIDVCSLLPLLMCNLRIMLVPSVITITLSYTHSWAVKLIDVIENSKYLVNKTKVIFKKFSNLPPKFYEKLDKEILVYQPESLLRYGIVDKVLDLGRKKLSIENVIKYYDISNI